MSLSGPASRRSVSRASHVPQAVAQTAAALGASGRASVSTSVARRLTARREDTFRLRNLHAGHHVPPDRLTGCGFGADAVFDKSLAFEEFLACCARFASREANDHDPQPTQ